MLFCSFIFVSNPNLHTFHYRPGNNPQRFPIVTNGIGKSVLSETPLLVIVVGKCEFPFISLPNTVRVYRRCCGDYETKRYHTVYDILRIDLG